jgi:membrane protease subunit HflK
MAWNEPGGGDKDPWGGRNDQGPPDLDEVVRRMRSKFGGLFGSGKGGGGRGGKGGPPFAGFGALLIIAVVVWVFYGIYIVDAGKQGVVLRFGAFKEITSPGPHWRMPFIEQVEIVDVEQRFFVEVGYRSSAGTQSVSVPHEALMLTLDENIVNIQLAVQYQVSDARNYWFNVRDPDAVLKQATESAIREVIGKNNMDFVLKEGRTEVVTKTKALMQTILDDYKAGLLVSDVNLQDAQPPEEVQGAFSDAIKAREDKERLKNEAEAYSNEVIPTARGAAARQLEEANAYKSSLIAKAEGEAARFEALFAEYKKAPEVTRKRLYMETIEAVMANTGKVIVDSDNANNLMYLPIDRLLEGGAAPSRRTTDSSSSFSNMKRAPAVNSEPARGSTRSSREPR